MFEPRKFAKGLLGGNITWLSHVSNGINALGHTCHVLTFSGNGKPSKNGYVNANQRCEKTEDMTSVLDEYDFVILNTLGMPGDRKLKLNNELPHWLKSLSKSKTKFSMYLHEEAFNLCKTYSFWKMLPTLKNFSGFAFANSNLYVDSYKKFKHYKNIDYFVVNLPYNTKTPSLDLSNKNKVFYTSMIGRSIKGYDRFFEAIPFINYECRIYGRNLQFAGYNVLKRKEGFAQYYFGQYVQSDLAEMFKMCKVHVNPSRNPQNSKELRNAVLSKGHLEYVTMDAVAHLCFPIVPVSCGSMLPNAYEVDTRESMQIANAVNTAMSMPMSIFQKKVAENFKFLKSKHSITDVSKEIVKVLQRG